MNASIQDGIPMRGDLTIVVRNAGTRAEVRRIEIRNKITFLAADILVELLAQRAPPADPAPDAGMVYSMRMGTSNTAAARTDMNLGAFIVAKLLTDVNKVVGIPGELEFTSTLESGDGNGATLQEAGLFTKGDAVTPTESDAPGVAAGNPRMIARQIHPPIPKTVAISIEYSWRIAFTA